MLGDLQVEFTRLSNEVSVTMYECNPAQSVRAAMQMATALLGAIPMRLRTEQDPEERRKLINEFWKGRNTIEKIITGYRRNLKDRELHPEQEPRRALP